LETVSGAAVEKGEADDDPPVLFCVNEAEIAQKALFYTS
jgi:hypothetical protein